MFQLEVHIQVYLYVRLIRLHGGHQPGRAGPGEDGADLFSPADFAFCNYRRLDEALAL